MNARQGRRGPSPDQISDAEVLTLLLVGELCRCPRERAWLRQVRASYAALFPTLPEESRFQRRAERVAALLVAMRETLLFWADADLERERIMDSFPLLLCACYRIHQSNQPVDGSAFDRCASKRALFIGLRPQLLVTLSGFRVDLCLAPGNCPDIKGLTLSLEECGEFGRDLRGQLWLLDKGYRSKEVIVWAQAHLWLTLLPRQQEPKGSEPTAWQLELDGLRHAIEGVIAVLTDGFGIQRVLASTALGVYRRVQAKATAFTQANYFNRALGLPTLDIDRYAV